MSKMLILEDEESLRRQLSKHLRKQGHDVVEATTCAEAMEQIESVEFDAVLADVVLPDGLGFTVVDALRQRGSSAALVVMSGEASVEYVVGALRRGADDFLSKPFSLPALDAAFGRVDGVKAFGTTPPASEQDLDEWRSLFCPEIVGKDRRLMKVFDVIRRVADTDCPVLITGETGTGKELVAQAIHRASSERQAAPFVPVNCASIPENLMESELFGHAKGAFTGAASSYKGRFEVADGGTLLLDEIGEMAAPLQAKLLRVLQEGEIRPIGEGQSRKVDVRIIAATHRDVEAMAEAKEFREDLLYRLDVIRIELPSLRERTVDIPVLVEHFVRDAARRRGRQIDGLDAAAMAILTAYEWPGNVRQLRAVVERMVVLGADGVLGADDVPPKVRDAANVSSTPVSGAGPILPADGVSLRDAVEQFENALLLQALERTGWNKAQAASILQINRTTLVEKLKKKKIVKECGAA